MQATEWTWEELLHTSVPGLLESAFAQNWHGSMGFCSVGKLSSRIEQVRHRLAADIFYLHADFRHCKSFPLCSVSLYRSCSTLVQYIRPITTLDFQPPLQLSRFFCIFFPASPLLHRVPRWQSWGREYDMMVNAQNCRFRPHIIRDGLADQNCPSFPS